MIQMAYREHTPRRHFTHWLTIYHSSVALNHSAKMSDNLKKVESKIYILSWAMYGIPLAGRLYHETTLRDFDAIGGQEWDSQDIVNSLGPAYL